MATLLLAAAFTWIAAGLCMATLVEPERHIAPPVAYRPFRDAARLLVIDAPFRRYVVARALLLVSALSTPFVVMIAARHGGGLGALGPFVIASGVGALVGGPLAGWLSDRSSRLTMAGGAAAATAVVVLFLLALRVEVLREAPLLYPLTTLLLALAHTVVHTGRKVYVVDLGEGDARTRYVATSNTAMGALLLAVGGISSAVATLGAESALLLLAAMGAVGVGACLTLREVSLDEGSG